MDLRQEALTALACTNLTEKATRAQRLHALAQARLQTGLQTDLKLDLATTSAADLLARLPGRPERPHLIPPSDVPSRSPFTTTGRAALLHAICHIEFNAINLALDAVWRFPNMPPDYYADWLQVACEEAKHFGLLQAHLGRMGHAYGDFDAHDGLWLMCDRTANDIVARMALVPRTLEARGLDATPLIQAKLRKVGTPDAIEACDILDLILHDEVGHVAIGNHWFRWLCTREGLDPVAHYRHLIRSYGAPRLKPPYNLAAREQAGFTAAEIEFLLGDFVGDGRASHHLDTPPPSA